MHTHLGRDLVCTPIQYQEACVEEACVEERLSSGEYFAFVFLKNLSVWDPDRSFLESGYGQDSTDSLYIRPGLDSFFIPI